MNIQPHILLIISFYVMSVFAFNNAQAQIVRDENSNIQLSAALSEPKIAVDVDFDGSRITLFAVSDQWDNPDVSFAVALIGPKRPYIVTHNSGKSKEQFQFISAPSVLAIATEINPYKPASDAEASNAQIHTQLNARYSAVPPDDELANPKLEYWRKAFSDIKAQGGLFSAQDASLERLNGGLIRANIELPSDAPPGAYDVQILLFHDGILLEEAQTPLTLDRKGVEFALFSLAHNHPIFYGFIAVFLGVSVGLGGAIGGGRR